MLTQKIETALTKRKDKRRQMVLEEDPFAPEIMVVPLSKGFKQLLIESYDGVTDPLDYLWTFVDMMRLYAAPDAVMCWSFPPTLRREARDWVATLAPRSVRTFDHLSQSFVAYFLSSKRKRKTAISLMQYIQEKEKTLQDYLACFSRATLGIKDLQMSAVVIAKMNGTWNQSFKMSLSKNPPESMQELLRKGDKYVDAEEAKRVTKSLHDRRDSETNKRKSHDNQRERDDKEKQKVGPRDQPQSNKWPPDHRGTVAGGDSNSARKRYARSSGIGSNQMKTIFSQDITFGEKDLIRMVCPHDDALVIIGDIIDFDVKRVLIDNGSAVDVLIWDA
ncbi:Uncharacterized protein Adt_14010 [Abeliophyllum distichum]|uniref:Retrotransposon gag domain-containing protein n=1 Tax=Abeliophyllum distichum TaxID=126358 RepID=A0ABD1TYW7_9LAMI